MKKLYLIIALAVLYFHANYPSQVTSATQQEKQYKVNPKLNGQLFEAIKNNNVDRVRSLLYPQRSWYSFGKGAQSIPDVNAKDWNGWTPLLFAAGNTEIVKILLSAGADVNAHKIGYTAFSAAIQADNKEVASLFLDAGFEPSSDDLTYAARLPRYGIVKMLLEAGAQPTAEFWKLVKEDPLLMTIAEEYSKEAASAITGAIPEAGWQDMAPIISEYMVSEEKK